MALRDRITNSPRRLHSQVDTYAGDGAAAVVLPALSAEIEKAKKTRVDVAKKMESESSKYREWVEAKEGKMKLLLKDKRAKELEAAKHKQDLSHANLQLKRAREANLVLSRKVRDQDSSAQAAA